MTKKKKFWITNQSKWNIQLYKINNYQHNMYLIREYAKRSSLKVSSFLLHYELSKWKTARNFFPFHFFINNLLYSDQETQPWVVLIVVWGIPWPQGGGVCKVGFHALSIIKLCFMLIEICLPPGQLSWQSAGLPSGMWRPVQAQAGPTLRVFK